MNLPEQIAKHLRDVMNGGNWTASNLKDTLQGITWQQANEKVNSFNSIASLVYHISYFVTAILDVIQGRPLSANDKFSFDHPPVNSEEDWEKMKGKLFAGAELLASFVEQQHENKMWENFSGEKYGTWYRNLQGLIEHTHYHLGQISIIKKLLQQ